MVKMRRTLFLAALAAWLLTGCIQVERADVSDTSSIDETGADETGAAGTETSATGDTGDTGTTGDTGRAGGGGETTGDETRRGRGPALTDLLCRPCLTNSQCGSFAGEPLRCFDYGAPGHFCGSTCGGEGGGCPAGYSCVGINDSEGKTFQACRATGTCECSQDAVRDVAVTACRIGLCEGLRSCTPDGLSACDAQVPTTEVPGDLDDNDCDGAVDEEACQCGDGFCDASVACSENSLNCESDCGACGGESGCDDGLSCTDDLCGASGCENVAIPLLCVIEGACVQQGAGPGDPCLVCDSASPYGWSGNTGAACDDGDPCTVDDVCDGKTCSGTQNLCDDKILCTYDTCVGGECFHEEPETSCAIDGECVGAGVEKPGSLGCAACDPGQNPLGWSPLNAGCDDGDACTVDDWCFGQACVGTQATCDDKSPCTSDWCADGMCHHEVVDGWCFIGAKCKDDFTTNPGNPCEVCDADVDQSQWSPKQGGACDDGESCTIGDHCAAGGCVSGGWDQDDFGADEHWYDGNNMGTFQDEWKFDAASTSLGSLSPPDDVDWFKTHHEDADFLGLFNPRPRVDVAKLPGAMTVWLCIGYVCADGADPWTYECLSDEEWFKASPETITSCCLDGATVGSSIVIKPQCTGVDDTGTAYTRVTYANGPYSCGNYELKLGDD